MPNGNWVNPTMVLEASATDCPNGPEVRIRCFYFSHGVDTVPQVINCACRDMEEARSKRDGFVQAVNKALEVSDGD
ncbi:hypothetical protein M0R72_10515 [Candidatus Pacearchaeota archaeon]|nr:hypothetical protein [Candidatus Pacearchaeota archaeon]